MLLTIVTTNAAMWAGIVGFLTPLVIQTITKSHASRQVQSLIAFGFSLVVAVPTAYFAASLNVHDYVQSALIVFTLAMVTYEHLWKPVGVTPSTTTQE